MADNVPTSRLLTKSDGDAAGDEIRARELYKYFRPPAADGGSPDPILTAHAQLVAWRLNAERSMISLIDEDIQYFVAESTKTLHLDDAHKHDHPDDAIWAGCVRVLKAGRLCEHTIAAPVPQSGGPACFEVSDLTQDTRFNQLEFVSGPPNFRYYAGVPLRTPKGINIGSLFIIDAKTRPVMTAAEKRFLGVIADNVVQHLVMLKEQTASQRALKMSASMSDFVDPLQETLKNDADCDEDQKPSSRAGHVERFTVYSRAAALLQAGLDYDFNDGSVTFLDTLPLRRLSDQRSDEDSEASSGQDMGDEAVSTSNSDWYNATEVLAQATESTQNPAIKDAKRLLGKPISPKDLQRLIQRHPKGKLFTFDSRGNELSISSDENTESTGYVRNSKPDASGAGKSELKKLQSYFPGARQIIFLPLWDAATSRWSVCFAWHGSKFRNFTYHSEFVYCATFGSCVVAELTRLANAQSDQQKNDFIASISHELRSPLHGVLASCEFLEDTESTPFQKSLINTASSCARTLLDTINMVLDYSNINRSEKRRDHTKKSKRALQVSLSAQRKVNLAALVEEVVDGVVAGRSYEQLSARSDEHVSHHESFDGQNKNAGPQVIVDISMQDWLFWTEPGAIRRIVMNLVDNATKYTSSGYVHIKLDVQKLKDRSDSTELSSVVLTVSDTGRGMPQAFLEDKLYTPFAQESNVTAGIGLGLSLIKSIVRSLEGKINIESAIGVGTKATVKLPMLYHALSQNHNKHIPNQITFDNAADSDRKTDISVVQEWAIGKTVAIFWGSQSKDNPHTEKATQLLRESLESYLSAWFGFTVCAWTSEVTFDIVVSTSEGLEELKRLDPRIFFTTSQVPILFLGDFALHSPLNSAGHDFEGMRCPFGPIRLAQAIKASLARASQHLDIGKVLTLETGGAGVDVEIQNEKEDRNSIQVSRTAKPQLIEDQEQKKNVQVVYPCPEDHTTLIASVDPVTVVSIGADTKPEDAPHLVINESVPRHDSRIDENTQTTRSASIENIEVDKKPNASQMMTLLDAPSNRTSWTSAQAPDATPSSPRILLVDDNTINLRLLQVFTHKLGHNHVDVAEDGQIAVEKYQAAQSTNPSSPPHVILMDLSMPVMDGFEATRQIRQLEARYNKRNPTAQFSSLIIALTGLASVRDQKYAFTSGVDQYIMKPVNFAKLTPLLKDWESNSRPARRSNEVP